MMITSTIPNYVFDKATGWRIDLPLLIAPGTRVICLYRVSTDKQLYHTQNDEADIPMQKIRCREFAEKMGWTIVCELQEEGVSGHKVRAEKRDKIQLIKEYATQGKFDILLVFMFDRLGRITDETPFVLEWFVQNGIRVWSATEGEQRIENHTDRLMNFIRFWQADGESQKISIRTANSLHILTEAGCFTGGICPYGYEFVKTGRTNKRKQPVNDLSVKEEEARIVRLMFNLASAEGYGAQRIANFLNEQGIKNRSEKNWHPASIQAMLRNILYTGVLRSGESRSEKQEALAIVDDKTFRRVQEMLAARSRKNEAIRSKPLNTRGNSLLSGMVFCGHCGARLCVTTSGKGRRKADGTETVRTRYTCQTKSRTHGDCDGQTGYTVGKLDKMMEDIIRSLLSKVQSMHRSEILDSNYYKKQDEKQAILHKVQTDCEKAEDELHTLKAEIVKAISGESAFSPELLNTVIREKESECMRLREKYLSEEQNLRNSETEKAVMDEQFDDLLEWSAVYADAPMSAKKMIVSQLIDRVEVFRGYKLKMELNISVKQFFDGMGVEVPLEISA